VGYLPLLKYAVLKSAYHAAWVSGQNLFRNELYQIGGFQLLRGFDEQSLFTNHYHVFSMEFRILTDQNSYFYFFSDNGFVETRFNKLTTEGWYHGFGVGATLETKTGLFNVSYGLGAGPQNPVQFRLSKIHFGYAAFF
jgi:hemolysin activation/secretion protein